MSDLPGLYDEVIKNHNTTPYHFARIENCSQIISANNFICGDRFDLCLKMINNSIEAVHFHGFGCAVSKASASVLAKLLEGKSRSEALRICDQFLRLLKNELRENEKLFSDEFRSFLKVQEFPSRYDCAALPWEEIEKYLTE